MFGQNVGFFMAFGAGLVSFLSPCILPVIPSYLAFIGGVAYGSPEGATPPRVRIFVRTLFFSAGFSAVFVALGVVFSGAGMALSGAQTVVNAVSGALTAVLGLNVIFDFWKLLNFERRLHFRERPRGGALGSFLLGIAFGAGWTPCVGPILASILFLAGTAGTVARGAFLLGAYSLGLAVPFLLAGAFFGFFSRQAARLKPHVAAIRTASGLIIVLLGVLIFFGGLSRLNAVFSGLARSLDEWGRRTVWGPRILFGSLFLALAGLAAFPCVRRARAASLRGESLPGIPLILCAVLALLCASASAAVFAGVLDVPSAVSSWFRFQGI